MTSDVHDAVERRRRRWLSLGLIQVGLLLSALKVIEATHEHRGWWVAAAVVTELLLVGAVVEVALRNRRESRAEARS